MMGHDITKSGSTCKCTICHYWQFLRINLWWLTCDLLYFNQKYAVVVMMWHKNLWPKIYYRDHFWGILQKEAINQIKNTNLSVKGTLLWLSKKFHSDVKLQVRNNDLTTKVPYKNRGKCIENDKRYYEENKESFEGRSRS